MLTVDEFVEEIPFRETRGHVRRVISNLAVYSALYGRSGQPPSMGRGSHGCASVDRHRISWTCRPGALALCVQRAWRGNT
jgi:hypothetical protein